MTDEVKKVSLPFDEDTFSKVERAAEAEHLALATWCRRILLMYLEGRLVEKSPEPCECPKG